MTRSNNALHRRCVICRFVNLGLYPHLGERGRSCLKVGIGRTVAAMVNATNRTSTLWIAFTHVQFLVAMLLPCLEGRFLYNDHWRIPGWLCFVGSCMIWGRLFEEPMVSDSSIATIGNFCSLTYFPCTVCVILWPLALLRWCGWFVRPLRTMLILGSITSLAVFLPAVFPNTEYSGRVLVGSYVWMAAMSSSAVASLIVLKAPGPNGTKPRTNNPMDRSGGSAAS